jgi:TetR/AcrR family transcriptional regulator
MGRNPQRNAEARDRRREAILEAARDRFAGVGLRAARIGDIARAAGISPGLVYHYFGSKEEIFTTLVREAFNRQNVAALRLESLSLSPRDKLKMAVGGLLRNLERDPAAAANQALLALAASRDDTPADARDVVASESATAHGIIARILRAGQDDGSVRPHDADQMATLFWSAIHGLALERAARGDGFRAPAPDTMLAMFMEG